MLTCPFNRFARNHKPKSCVPAVGPVYPNKSLTVCSSDFVFQKYKQDSALRVSGVLQLAKTGPLVTKNSFARGGWSRAELHYGSILQYASVYTISRAVRTSGAWKGNRRSVKIEISLIFSRKYLVLCKHFMHGV